MFDRLVVGFDGSQPSVAALQWVASEAQLRRATVDAIACVFVPVLFPVWLAGEIPLFAYEVESMRADAALDWAVDEADRRGAEFVVHAWSYPYGGTELAPSEMHDRTRVDASLVLGVAVERCQQRAGVSVRGQLLENSAAPALIEQGLHADMVVIGSRGRGRFRTLLFGSVARAVSEHAPCPIVVIQPPRT